MKEPRPFTERMPQLPVAYGKPRIVCLVKNTHWVYAFWELVPKQVRELENQLGMNYRKVLRVYLIDSQHEEIVIDVTITEEIGTHYLYLPYPGQSYRVDLMGISGERAICLLSSNVVKTPSGKLSEIIDEEWATIEEVYVRYQSQMQIGSQTSPMMWNVSSPMVSHLPLQQVGEIDLEIATELIIFGKASSGTTVHIQGEAINTRPDGSFSVRYALDDGTYVYPIKAVSKDGAETKTHVPIVTRETY